MDGLRPTVVWDVDDVLNSLTAAWLEQAWAPAHSRANVAYADLRENPPDGILGMDRAAYLASLDAFRLGGGYAAMPPNSAITEWLGNNGERCHHVALTATPLRAAPSSAAWVLRHFGAWIREVAVIPSDRPGELLPRFDTDKGAWIARHRGPIVLVDDSEPNLASARTAGAAAIAWPQPWNGSAGAAAQALAQLDHWLGAQ